MTVLIYIFLITILFTRYLQVSEVVPLGVVASICIFINKASSEPSVIRPLRVLILHAVVSVAPSVPHVSKLLLRVLTVELLLRALTELLSELQVAKRSVGVV